jgi:hypothetical protein
MYYPPSESWGRVLGSKISCIAAWSSSTPHFSCPFPPPSLSPLPPSLPPYPLTPSLTVPPPFSPPLSHPSSPLQVPLPPPLIADNGSYTENKQLRFSPAQEGKEPCMEAKPRGLWHPHFRPTAWNRQCSCFAPPNFQPSIQPTLS